jgi:hypothetical protein
MNAKKKLLFAAAALIAASLACGGSAAVAIGDIPVFTGAQSVAPGTNAMVDELTTTIEQSAGLEDVTIDSLQYSIPAGTPWATIKDFYTQYASSGDWTAETNFDQEAGIINVTGWSRGGITSQQALVIAQVEDPLSGEAFLIVMLFSQ